MIYINIKNKKRYKLLAYAIDSTNERDGLPVIVYCPCDNENSIFVRNQKEFFDKFITEQDPYCGAVDNLLNGVN